MFIVRSRGPNLGVNNAGSEPPGVLLAVLGLRAPRRDSVQYRGGDWDSEISEKDSGTESWARNSGAVRRVRTRRGGIRTPKFGKVTGIGIRN